MDKYFNYDCTYIIYKLLYNIYIKAKQMKYVLILLLSLSLFSCSTTNNNHELSCPSANVTVYGSMILGGVAGGVIGHQTSNTGEGAAIGILAGGLIGAAGHYLYTKESGNCNCKQQNIIYVDTIYHQTESIVIPVEKTIIVEERVPIQTERRKYYVDSNSGRRIYLNN